MLYGIIDIGSNTMRLAIYLIEGQRMEMLMKKKELVGLAGYLKDGVMQPEGIDRAAEVLQGFQSFLATFRITQVVAFTTAALRNAKNSKEAVAALEARTGLKIRVITGEEEATFDFIGATHDLTNDAGILLDVGGGSTEIVAYSGEEIEEKVSLPIGSLALRTDYVQGVLPLREECLRMHERAEGVLAGLMGFENLASPEIVGIGGTFKGANALYNLVYNQPATNKRMETRLMRGLIEDFQIDDGMTEPMTIARRFHARNIIYSDSGVREGFIYAEIIGKK